MYKRYRVNEVETMEKKKELSTQEKVYRVYNIARLVLAVGLISLMLIASR